MSEKLGKLPGKFILVSNIVRKARKSEQKLGKFQELSREIPEKCKDIVEKC